MKVTPRGELANEVDRVKGEAALLQALDSDFVIRAEEIYQWDERLYVFLDYMDGKEITNVIMAYH